MSVAPLDVAREADVRLAEQARVLQQIACDAPLPGVLESIARLAASGASDVRAAILLIGPDGRSRVAAARGLPAGCAAALEGLPAAAPSADGVATWTDAAAVAARYGLPASRAFPIDAPDRAPWGALVLYAADPRRLEPADTEIGVVAAALAAVALVRHRAAAELRSSTERLRLVGCATDDAIWDWDLVHGSLWWGDAVETRFGHARRDLEPDIRSWTTRLHPDDRDRVVSGIHALIDSGGSGWSDEYRFRRADGSYAMVFDRGYVIHDDAGRPVRMVGSMMDITDRRRAHEALAARERQLLEAQRVARVGSWEWDPEADCVTWSDQMYRLYGVVPERFPLSSAAILALIVPAGRAVVERATRDWVRHRRPFAYDIDVRRPDGELRTLQVRGHTSLAASEPPRLVGTAQDVTDARRLEARLRDSQRRLRTLTAHREAIREDERARIAREIHDELGQALTAFKLDVAWVRMSLPDAPPDIHGRLDDLATRVDATVKFVRRIGSELRPVVLDQLGLGPAVEWQVRDFAARTGLRADVRADLAGHRLSGEIATCLFRILQEALTNVARHAEAGGVAVRLRVVDGTVWLDVTDDGRGIAETDLSEPRALGILGMRERALLLGGALELGSAEPSGTRLSVWIPVRP
jgi:PAS domain S-box-containing protein